MPDCPGIHIVPGPIKGHSPNRLRLIKRGPLLPDNLTLAIDKIQQDIAILQSLLILDNHEVDHIVSVYSVVLQAKSLLQVFLPLQ